ncbi:hypothetical protein F0365_04430 [Nonlabens sp. Ci31]|uniref:hypothetical protein n=1 Tax=Nonlabens sp. Ci31 TaxID=2608253 RepID=UPI001463FDE7|nr:hypothetical protein [Nonlabens sp. Ci31]QJP33704.1 hypothetical protein F0365_04430 [Nonlabens sp. Ci31]
MKNHVATLKIKQFNAVQENGKIEAQIIEQDDKSVAIAIDTYFCFDKDGKTIEKQWFMNSVLVRRFEYKYDQDSFLKTKKEFNSKGEQDVTTYYYYQFNNKGHVIEQKAVSEETEEDAYIKLSRFEKGFKITEEYYYPVNDSPTERKEFEYDQQGRTIKEITYYDDSELAEINTNQYNEAGYLIKTTNFYKQEKLTEISEMEYLEFDTKGNCTKLLIRVNRIPQTISKMEYTYY